MESTSIHNDDVEQPSQAADGEGRRKRSRRVDEVPAESHAVLTTSEVLRLRVSDLTKPPQFRVGSDEMYRRFPDGYDLLMRCHDCTSIGHALLLILSTMPKSSVRLLDLGCGTGRIACLVAQHPSIRHLSCYDKHEAMLRRSAVNLEAAFAASKRPNRYVDDATSDVPSLHDDSGGLVTVCLRPFSFEHVVSGSLRRDIQYNIVTAAWAMSYIMRKQWDGGRWHAELDATIAEMRAAIDRRSDAYILIVETLGTGCTSPKRNSHLAERLINVHNFTQTSVRTDYHFPSVEEGRRLCQFFFGPAMAGLDAVDLPECTGIYTLLVPRQELPPCCATTADHRD